MIRYPNGKAPIFKEKNSKPISQKTYGNRGMSLESDISSSLEYYANQGLAIITKRPTPINVVKVDYTHGARITDAFFEKQSTTDYNGVYQGKYIDFEAKNTLNKTSFPLANITVHQILHLKRVLFHGGIAFFIISFEFHNKIFLLDAKYVIDAFEMNDRKSIPYETITRLGVEIKQSFIPRLQILKAIDEVYFHEKIS